LSTSSASVEATVKDEEIRCMRLTKLKVLTIVGVPLLLGACVIAAAQYLMLGPAPPPMTTAAPICVPTNAPVYRVARHGHGPPVRHEVISSPPQD
jgi:hypothetical protein